MKAARGLVCDFSENYRGISAYTRMEPAKLWWLLLITAAVLAGFFFMFRKIVDSYCARIAGPPEKTTLWQERD